MIKSVNVYLNHDLWSIRWKQYGSYEKLCVASLSLSFAENRLSIIYDGEMNDRQTEKGIPNVKSNIFLND